MSKNLSVYIISTVADLHKHRVAVIRVLNQLGFEVVALEAYGSSEAQPLETSLRALAEADIVLLLLAHRYGYIPPSKDKSIIELEYAAALDNKKPVFVYMVDDDTPWQPMFIERGNGGKALQEFKQLVKSNHVVSLFQTPDDLAAKVAADIARYTGTISPNLVEQKHSQAVSINDVMNEIVMLRNELSAFQQFVTQPNQIVPTGIYTFSTDVKLKPADFLGPSSVEVNYSQCFVIMPYSEKWSEALEKILKEICQSVEIKFVIAKTMNGRFIPNDIWRGITGSGIIIADLSKANPNVTYEIGLADVIGREVILICQGDEVPFDFLGQRLILYEDSITGTIKLREELIDRLRRFKEQYTSDFDK